MTDSHCDNCGDPIFRYDGQEFCATCQAEGVPAEAAGESETEAGTAAEAPEPDQPAPEDAGVEPAPAENGQTPPAAPDPRTPETTPAERAAPAAEPEPATTREPTAAGRDRAPARSSDDGDDLRAARDSLARTVARFARRAEETDSPREATDHLAAAREAAEALAALDRR